MYLWSALVAGSAVVTALSRGFHFFTGLLVAIAVVAVVVSAVPRWRGANRTRPTDGP
jgi:hypothetical protein